MSDGISALPVCSIEGYELRAAVMEDVDDIVLIDRANMKAEVEKHYPGEWDEEKARAIVVDNLSRARVLTCEGRMIGVFYWWVEPPDIAVLHSIQIAPSHRSKGLGIWLMRVFEREAVARGLTTAGLAVFRDNRAISLYRRLGYEVTGTDGPNAVEMRKKLQKERELSRKRQLDKR